MKNLLMAVFVFVSIAAFSQSRNVLDTKLKLNAQGFDDKLSGTYADQTCQFIFTKGKKIDWVQDNGAYSLQFDITKVEGKWKDVNNAGEASFYFKHEKANGKIVITQAEGVITLSLEISGLDSGDIYNVYKITSKEIL